MNITSAIGCGSRHGHGSQFPWVIPAGPRCLQATVLGLRGPRQCQGLVSTPGGRCLPQKWPPCARFTIPSAGFSGILSVLSPFFPLPSLFFPPSFLPLARCYAKCQGSGIIKTGSLQSNMKTIKFSMVRVKLEVATDAQRGHPEHQGRISGEENVLFSS